MLRHCLCLEGVRHNSKDVLQALSSFLKEDIHRVDGSLLSLAYMDFSSCFTIFSPRLDLLPWLQEVRVGADVPPHLKSQSRKHSFEAPVPQGKFLAALERLSVLTRLRTLVLKDVLEQELEVALGACGHLLTRLDLHYMSHGVHLGTIGKMAPRLRHLAISDSLVDCDTSKPEVLVLLETCHLMRVTYRGGSERVVLESCPKLSVLHMEAGSGLEEEWLVKLIMARRSTFLLEEFVVRGACSLGLNALSALTSLASVRRIGDLQDWAGLRGEDLELTKTCDTMMFFEQG